MAGNYPDYPAPRIPWHLDGTAMVGMNNVSPPTTVDITADLSARGKVNNESGDDWPSPGNGWKGWVFPRLLDLDGIYLYGPAVAEVEWSPDTTNCLDGTWTQVTADFTESTADSRSTIRSLSLTGVKGLRAHTTAGSLVGVHFFGAPTSRPTDQQLAIWHPSSAVPVGGAHFDWGNAPRGSSADITFRVKNLSATETAEDIAVTLVDSTDSSPSFTDAHYLSTDGTTFTASLSNIGDLAPGATSGVVTLRRVLSSSQPLGTWAALVKAEADAWV